MKDMNLQDVKNHSVLLVEDDEKLSRLIAKYLAKNGFSVDTVFRGDDAVKSIQQSPTDLIVLDIMLPGMNGFEVCKAVRHSYKGAILMLTANDEDIDQIIGLEIGADDYVVKPVEPRLLLARIRALLRRTTNELAVPSHPDQVTFLEFGSLKIDQRSRIVTLADKFIDLTSIEFELLWLLASHAGKTQSREYICKTIFNIEYNGINRSVDNKISLLRKLLLDNHNKPRRIKTIRGKGYLFVDSAW